MKVCILTAGKGSRMGAFSHTVHKALLPLNNKAIIGRIIEQFTDSEEFVVAIGFNKDQIKDYLTIAYPKKKFTFVVVDNYDGPGSGPGHSLFCCREYLQEPFVFTACDTLIVSALPVFQENWIGIKQVENIEKWCSVKINDQKMVTDIFYKEKSNTDLAFVGIAFVKDYGPFWMGLQKNNALLGGELQVNNGLEALIPYKVKIAALEWDDAGNEENYAQLLSQYSSNFSFDGKITDLTYKHDNRIIKFFPNSESSKLRYYRASQYRGIFSKTEQLQGNFYSYTFEEGVLLSELMNADECLKFLEWSQTYFWKELAVDLESFKRVSEDFYYQKTLKRLNDFCNKYLLGGKERYSIINGMPCQTVDDLLNHLGKQFYGESLPSTYHGDLHDDNVIVTNDSRYVFIDWRESFGPSVDVGDRYYDFGKFVHTLNFSVEAMKNKAYQCSDEGDKIYIKHATSSSSQEAAKAFWDFIAKHHYDAKRIRIIEALIFINMSSLYTKDLGTYLYYLGRYLLQIEMNQL